jgi:hypothetical protein
MRCLLIAVVAFALAGCASSGRALLDEREQNGERLYYWAWYNIVDKDYYQVETMTVRELNGREVKLTIHYCGPEKMKRLNPCRGDRLNPPCLVNYGWKDNILARDIYVLAGHLCNGRLIVLGLEAELNKRYGDIRQVKFGL